MKTIIKALAVAAMVLVSNQVLADADDAAWIGKCVTDNAKEGASAETVAKYCSCMNNKMSSSETQSITQWEQSHPAEMKACEAEAGWK
jgi:hypothetical protein